VVRTSVVAIQLYVGVAKGGLMGLSAKNSLFWEVGGVGNGPRERTGLGLERAVKRLGLGLMATLI
jgi:hypothetical protein